MQNDRNEMKLHNEYDYECIRNTLSLIHYFPGKYVLAFNLHWSALKSKQHTCVDFLFARGEVGVGGGDVGVFHQLLFFFEGERR